ncbi:ENV1 protein, partial [Alectura lathami]|nr:ENV1 protein [Alectura lathami]
WQLLQASYQILNETSPNLTNLCWLCYDVRPPYYEAIVVNFTYELSKEQNPPQCEWAKKRGSRQGLTLQLVKGIGSCVG